MTPNYSIEPYSDWTDIISVTSLETYFFYGFNYEKYETRECSSITNETNLHLCINDTDCAKYILLVTMVDLQFG